MTEEADRMRKQPEEWLDVCDNQGNPTGERVLRSAAHRDGTPHRTAHVWLIHRRPAGGFDVLLQKRSREKDAFPGCYDISSAGHIPAGDGFVESALRELEEELGIRAEPSELVRIGLCDTRVDTEFHGCPFRNREISAVFVCEKPVQRSDFHLQREEVEEVCWIDYEECRRRMAAGTLVHCISAEEFGLLGAYVQKKVRWHMVLTGRVQGVGFRYRASAAADALGIVGWVRNCWNGTVEMEVQGSQEAIDRMLERTAASRWVQIDHIAKTQMTPEEERGFHVRSDW